VVQINFTFLSIHSLQYTDILVFVENLIPDEHTNYQVALIGTAEKVRLSGLPDEHTHYQVHSPNRYGRKGYLISTHTIS
jgi:hypothetical protein